MVRIHSCCVHYCRNSQRRWQSILNSLEPFEGLLTTRSSSHVSCQKVCRPLETHVDSSIDPISIYPALLTITSMRPYKPTAFAATALRLSCSAVTSSCNIWAPCAFKPSRAASLRPVAITFSPRWRRVRARSLPIPELSYVSHIRGFTTRRLVRIERTKFLLKHSNRSLLVSESCACARIHDGHHTIHTCDEPHQRHGSWTT